MPVDQQDRDQNAGESGWQPQPQQPPVPSSTQMVKRSTVGTFTALLGGVLVFVGSFLPWAKVTAVFVGSVSASGTDGTDGWFSIGLGFAIAALAVLALMQSKPMLWWALLPGVGAVVMGIVELFNATDRIRQANDALTSTEFGTMGHASIGSGLIAILIGGLLALVGVFVSRRAQPSVPEGAVDVQAGAPTEWQQLLSKEETA